MGGSLGAKKLMIRLEKHYQNFLKNIKLFTFAEKGNLDESLQNKEGYRQFEYVHGELPDILAVTDFVISRAGSNAIFEF